MSKKQCFIIGIGGTGSKCLESFVHLSACGLGPDEDTWIGMVDQDESNGNLRRTRDLIELYDQLYKGLRTSDNNLKTCDLFKTRLLSTENKSWCPIPKATKQFKEHFSYNLMGDKQQKLFNTLFEEAKRDLTLEVGFRGWPSMGAAIFLSQISSEHTFWKNIFDSIKSVKEGNEVRIFLIASIFGGTGAAGFPNIARLIRGKLKEMGSKLSNFYLGGALLLPYFSYPSEDDGERAAMSDAFLENAQGALKYYCNLMESESLFDSTYLIGWNPLINLNYFEKGGNNQENTPLVPELFSALAASKFFQESELQKGYLISARDDKDKIGWEQFPKVTDDNPGEIRDKMGQLIRFSFAYLHAYHPYLSEDRIKEIKRQKWYKTFFYKQGIVISDHGVNTVLENLEEYSKRVLKWIASISYLIKELSLVEVEAFSSIPENIGKGMVEIKDPINFDKDKFMKIIHPLDLPSLPLYKIYSQLQRSRDKSNRLGLGAFCGTLYDLCKVSKK